MVSMKNESNYPPLSELVSSVYTKGYLHNSGYMLHNIG